MLTIPMMAYYTKIANGRNMTITSQTDKGQALVEFVLVLPILLFILAGIVEFGTLFYNKQVLTNAKAFARALKDAGLGVIKVGVLNASPRPIRPIKYIVTYYVPKSISIPIYGSTRLMFK